MESKLKVFRGNQTISIFCSPTEEIGRMIIDHLKNIDEKNMDLPEENRCIRIMMNYVRDLDEVFLWQFTKELRKTKSTVEIYCGHVLSTSQLPIFLSANKRFAFRESEFELRKDNLIHASGLMPFISKACPKLNLNEDFFGKCIMRNLDANEAWVYGIITQKPLGSCVSYARMLADLDRTMNKSEHQMILEKYIL